jgi:hypothetical protein
MAKMYVYLGVVLALIGSGIALLSYITIDSVPLTAVGFSTLILGLTSIGLANTRTKLSPEACLMFLKAGVKNTLAILEELEIKGKAIYLPRSMMKGRSEAIILLNDEGSTQNIKEKLSKSLFVGYELSLPLKKRGSRRFKEILPRHIVLDYGAGSKDKAITITTLGNISLDSLKDTPGDTADEIKSAITYILTKILDIASGVRVNVAASSVKVEVTGAETIDKDMFYGESLYSHILGSPIASIAAAICSEALEKPIRITFETFRKGAVSIVLEVIP